MIGTYTIQLVDTVTNTVTVECFYQNRCFTVDVLCDPLSAETIQKVCEQTLADFQARVDAIPPIPADVKSLMRVRQAPVSLPVGKIDG